MTGQESVYAGVDLGGTNVQCALAKSDGLLLASGKIPTNSHEGPRAVLERVAALTRSLGSEIGSGPRALGLGVPGLADLKLGSTRFLPNLPTNWRDVPVAGILSASMGCPVYLLNDVRMATLGELVFGHGRSSRTMAFFALGTGIGGGIAIDGRLRLGPLGAAGELGHQTILPDGPRCGCGNRGCLEALVSGPAITAEGVRLLLSGQAPELHKRVRGDASLITPAEMAIAAAEGDDAVREAIIRASRFLGIAAANVITILHPDLIVFGGGVAAIGPMLFETVRRTVQERVRMLPVDDIRIEPSLLGDKAGILGGIALAMKGGFSGI
jgi:glucokinase